MSIDAQTLKGFRDFLPKDVRKRDYALSTLKKVFSSYGFEPLETPALEYDEVLSGKYGEESDKLMYRFEDQGGRKVALRYDQTVPLARVISQYQNDIPLPFKRYQIQNVWRAENTQKGRYREFLQVDIDTVGSNSAIADGEIIEIAIKSFLALGFKKFKVLINDREIFQNLINANLIEPNSLLSVLRAVDKLAKIGEEGVGLELEKLGIDKNKRNLILNAIKDEKPTENLKQIFEYLKSTGVDEKYFEFSPALARGLDYYTSTIFEVIMNDYTAGSLAGGGRYDNLIGLFSKSPIPAVGLSFGFDRIIELMTEKDLFPVNVDLTKVLITNTSPNSSSIATEVRQMNINAELYPDDKDIGKQLRYADKKGIPFVLIVDDKLTLKNMINGDQKEIELAELPEIL